MKAKDCADLIKNANKIAVLSGAGISTSAGIADFRGPNGLYVTGKYDPDKIFDISYFNNVDPSAFYDFSRDFIDIAKNIKPSVTHNFFAELENIKKVVILTQNIDMLQFIYMSKMW